MTLIRSMDCNVYVTQDKAIKVCWRADQYDYAIQWFKECGGLHVPQIELYEKFAHNYSICVMERLNPVESNDKEMNQFAQICYGVADERTIDSVSLPASLLFTAISLGEYALKHVLPLDLNYRNFLRRDTGELVIVDPFF